MKPIKHQPIRLYWGENYAPMPQLAKKVIAAAYRTSYRDINLYPGNWQDKVLITLSKSLNIHISQIIIGNGIEGLLQLIFHTFIKKDDEVITFNPTFGGYTHNAMAVGAFAIPINVRLDSQIYADEVMQYVSQKTKMMIFASPNTMTGAYHLTDLEIEKLAKLFKGLIVIDECYFGIGKMTILPLIHKYSNLLVLRSASKSLGLAGIRTGWAMGSSDIVGKLASKSLAVSPDPLPTVSYAVLKSAYPFGQEIAKSYVEFRNEFAAKLSHIKGLKVYPTHTTFIPVGLAETKHIGSCISELKKYGVLIKDTSLLEYLLVGVPPKNEWKYVLSCFQKVLSSLESKNIVHE